MEPSPEEQADAILRDWAREQGKSLRQLGIVDERRMTTINEREIPMSAVWPNTLPASARQDRDDDWEDE